MRVGRVAVLVLVVAGVIAFFAFDLGRFLTLESLKAQQASVQEIYSRNPTQVLAAFFAVYVLVTALSVPGGAILSLAAGAFFGLVTGTILVSFASSLGATLAFLTSRFLLRDMVQSRFKDRIFAVNEGIRKDGAFYLFSLRLIPVFPFFVVNLVMGLTPLKTSTYYWVSQLGMLPGTIVFINAGTQLGQIDSVRGILSPGLIGSFVVLGLFPLIAKKIVESLRGGRRMRQAKKQFKKPRRYDYDMVVIGAGSAGLVTSYISAAVKAKVALIEKNKMGGDCLNTGCVPSKALIRSARVLNDIRRAGEFGIRAPNPESDFSEVMERIQRVIRQIEPHDSVERYTELGVDCIQGAAKILSPYEVRVNDRVLTTRNITIATGARPLVPPIPGLDLVPHYTSEDLWSLRKKPSRLVVLGGGPIGCELAQAFQRLGCRVTLVERGPRLLPREDEDVSKLITERFESEGIRVLTRHEAKRFELTDGKPTMICTSASTPSATQDTRFEFDALIIALGRVANTKGFGLEDLGITTNAQGTIETDAYLRTIYPNIFVCGDAAGPYQFTHVAAHQAWYAAVNGLFRPFRQFKADYRVIPWCTYTSPEVARVGLNEQEAKEQGRPYFVSRYGIDDLDRAICEGEAEGFVKVLTEPGKDKILGVTIVGLHAGDIIAEYVLAMKHGLGLNKILGTIHIYPTLSEANKYAAGVWKKATAPQKLLGYLEKFHRFRRGAGT